jgi:hypothetical protein
MHAQALWRRQVITSIRPTITTNTMATCLRCQECALKAKTATGRAVVTSPLDRQHRPETNACMPPKETHSDGLEKAEPPSAHHSGHHLLDGNGDFWMNNNP